MGKLIAANFNIQEKSVPLVLVIELV